MFLRELQVPVTHLKGVGSGVARALAALGITNCGQLLSHWPRDWEDRTRTVPLSAYRSGQAVLTEALVTAHEWFGFGRMKTLKVHIEDESGHAVLICFNRPFLKDRLVEGQRYRIYGHFFVKYNELQSSDFDFEELIPGAVSSISGAILPIYPLSAGLKQGTLRKLIKNALREYAINLEEELPERIRAQHTLLSLPQTLQAIHFPQELRELEQAKKTIMYTELFYLELMTGLRAMDRKKTIRPRPSDSAPRPGLQEALLDRLPFKLTPGQIAALTEVNHDMDCEHAMARLLQGDVGSGKTLIAFLAALKAVENGRQAAILAPTELLARQHADNAARLLEPLGIRLAFLSGNIRAAGRKQLLAALAEGSIDIALGTHALFSSDVMYRDLGFICVDEQHRFGVMQRSAILAKGKNPDLLMMSATPIPRTLALTVFGDLEVSEIPDLPPGRKSITTHLAAQGNEQKVYDFVKKQLREGRQAYFVYPLIEESESLSLKNAAAMAEHLQRDIFPEMSLALVHSKIPEPEKRELMEQFRTGKIHVLVATSVVEVGVDVPNATCMVIEHAERFGLSALHQLRGRVGRGEQQSYCFLIYSPKLTEEGKARLKVMLQEQNGFIIAEEDLKLRGAGQLGGTEQSGYFTLGMADPVRDIELLKLARYDAFTLLEQDPSLDAEEGMQLKELLRRAPPFSDIRQ